MIFKEAIEETRKTTHTDYEWLKYHTRLQVKALEWERTRDTSRLLRGKELREAEQQLTNTTSKDPQPTDLQRQYILFGRRNEERQRRQITIGLSLGLVVMIALSFIAWEQRNSALSAQATAVAEANMHATAQSNAEQQAQIARARQMAAQAQSLGTDTGNHLLQSTLLATKSLNEFQVRQPNKHYGAG